MFLRIHKLIFLIEHWIISFGSTDCMEIVVRRRSAVIVTVSLLVCSPGMLLKSVLYFHNHCYTSP